MIRLTKIGDALKGILNGSWISNPKNVPTASVVVNNVAVRPTVRETQDIQKWRTALQSAEGYHQQRKRLYDLYDEILLDGFLRSLIDKRTAAITNERLVFTKDGKVIEDVTGLADQTFFATLLREILNARFYGHSLLQMDWAAPSSKNPSETILIPRRNVKPRLGIVTAEPHDVSGAEYRLPPFSDYVLEIGDREDLGLLLQACPYVIYKRGNFGDWAEFAEVFGMPFRWATYNNEQSRQLIEEALDKAGSAGYVVAPEDAKLQFLNATSGGQNSDIFSKLRDALNEELSITILGNTMTTTEAKSSGYAQSLTHQKGQNELHKDDRKFVLRVLNEKLTPFLARLGYAVEGGKWSFEDEDSMTMMEKLNIALAVSKEVPVGKSYWYETFKIPVPKADDLPDPKPEPPVTDPNAKPGASKPAGGKPAKGKKA